MKSRLIREEWKMSLDPYPTNEELRKIRKWDYKDFRGLMEYVESLWWHADWGIRKTQRRYYLSTGGWSGNESILCALRQNRMFWAICWVQSRRGGHYIFEIRKISKGK